MKIKLTLYKSLIIEAIKVETHLKSVIDRSTDDRQMQMAYHEAAGDEETHERKILRSIETSLATLKNEIANFLDPITATQGNNVYSETEDDLIYIHLFVDRRFNQAMAEPLAKFCSKYIEDNSLVLWWGAIGNYNQAKFYQELCNSDIVNIKNAFAKKVPVAVHLPYTTSLTIQPGETLTIAVGDSSTISYTIDADAIDDIEIDPKGHNEYLWIDRDDEGFSLYGVLPGVTKCKVYSQHAPDKIYKEIEIVVTK